MDVRTTLLLDGTHPAGRFGLAGFALLALLAAALCPTAAAAQVGVSGRVTDARNAPLDAVIVTARPAAGAGATSRTDATGRFRIDGLVPGRYRVSAEAVGYTAVVRDVQIGAAGRQDLDFVLRDETVVLEGLLVEGRLNQQRERTRFETEPGVTARVVERGMLKTLPGLAEADVLRAMEVLPGVISTSDFSSAFNVRGGGSDQNLILLDGFTVFNPFHLGGLFSVFNSDAVARAELLAGGFGAEYGGRVSSVLNIETDGRADEGLSFDAGVSVLATRLLARGRIPGAVARALGAESGTWLLSGRRSYFDQLLKPVVEFPYHFTDLQGYGEMALRGGGRLSLTGYLGDDVLDLSAFDSPDSDDEPGSDSTSILRIQWKWGNRVLGARWQQPLGDTWVADTRLGYSAFSDQLGFVDFDGIRFGSAVNQVTLRTELGREFGTGATLKVGGGVDRIGYDNFAEAGGTQFIGSADEGFLGAAFATWRWNPSDRWIVEPGVRADVWWGSNSTEPVVSPRFAVKRFFGATRTLAAKASVGRYAQFLQSLRNEEFPVSNDTWILSGASAPVVVSDQVQAALEKFWGESWYASAEGYARRFRGVSALNFADDPNDPDDDLLSGTGTSVGLDLFVRKSTGRLTGWTALSLLRARRTLPDPAAAGWDDISPTVTYPPIFDRGLDLDVVLQYQLPRNWEVGARWNYGSPIPYSRPIAQHFGFRYSPMSGRYEPSDQPGDDAPLFIVLGDRNSERYPPYHRLDATIRRTFQRGWGSWTPYLQVLNVYNRRNVLFYFYDYDRLPPTRSGISMFPVLPAIGLEASF